MGPFLRVMLLALLAVLLGLLDTVIAVQVQYCSSLNTGSDFESVVNTFQSHGACHDTCDGRYAFAIVQGNFCWCSNAAPGDTSPREDCSESCPGFPSDHCGNSDKNLYGYLQLGRKPSTTIGGSSPSGKPPTSAVDPTPAPTVTETIRLPPSESASLSSFTTSILTTSISSETTEAPSTTVPPTISIHTSNGQAVTVTVPVAVPTAIVEGDGNDSSLSPGSIAGIVIGCGAALAAIGLFMFWWFFYRRRQGSVKDDDYSSSFFERSVPRPMFQGTLGSRDAALAAASAEKGVNGYQSDPTSRLSVPAFTDSRLSPQVCLYPNGRGNSHVSLQDHQDYSRPVLRLTNPDP